MSSERRIESLLTKVDDNARILCLVEKDNVPGLHRLLATHFRNGGGLPSFINKLHKATDLKLASDNSFTRSYKKRGTVRDGKLDPETYRTLKLTMLMIKLGCH